MANKLETRQRSTLSITNIRDRRGAATTFDGTPTWTLSDPALGELVVGADGLSATVQSLDTFGTLVVEVRGDARKGDEVRELVGTATFTIAAGDVETFDLQVGAAEDVPESAPPPAG